MTPPKSNHIDDSYLSMREMIRQQIEQQQITNLEVIRLANVVYGNPNAKQPGLVGDNEKNKEYIEGDKKFKYGAAGILAAISFFGKDIFHKLFH